jgi:hypothetical protein
VHVPQTFSSAGKTRRLQVELHWDKKSEVVVRADEEIYESCFQGDSVTNAGTRCAAASRAAPQRRVPSLAPHTSLSLSLSLSLFE